MREPRVQRLPVRIWPAACRNGSCSDVSPETCLGAAGQARGVGTDCATTDPTCEPFEACCFPFGCSDREPNDCVDSEGVPQGVDTTCATASCPDQACCQADGSCADQPPEDCFVASGQPQGFDTYCASIDPSCQPFEACCTSFGCLNVLPSFCDDALGFAQGTGTECGSTTCPQLVPADLNGDARVDSGDFSIQIRCLADPGVTSAPLGYDPNDFARADINRNGTVDLLDVALLIQAYSEP